MKLDILGVTFDVIDEAPHSDSDGFMGLCCFMEQKILLNSTLPQDNRLSTLTHEMTHAITDTYDMQLSEEQVNLIAQGWFEVLKSNKLYREMFDVYNKEVKPAIGFRSKSTKGGK